MPGRDQTLEVRLSADERRELEDAAREQHLPVSTWLRAVGLDVAAGSLMYVARPGVTLSVLTAVDPEEVQTDA